MCKNVRITDSIVRFCLIRTSVRDNNENGNRGDISEFIANMPQDVCLTRNNLVLCCFFLNYRLWLSLLLNI